MLRYSPLPKPPWLYSAEVHLPRLRWTQALRCSNFPLPLVKWRLRWSGMARPSSTKRLQIILTTLLPPCVRFFPQMVVYVFVLTKSFFSLGLLDNYNAWVGCACKCSIVYCRFFMMPNFRFCIATTTSTCWVSPLFRHGQFFFQKNVVWFIW